MGATRVEMRGITKRFPGVVANDGIDFSANEGEIHALVGENGAGKTTLMNVLYGLVQPDSGTILVRGRPEAIRSAARAIGLGIGMVHQHFMLVPSYTIAQNVVLGSEPRRGPFVDVRRAVRDVSRLSRDYHLEVDPLARVQDVSVGVRQRVEILKALYRGAEVLILDEPTAVLTPQEADALFVTLRSLKSAGKTVVFITHKLPEVLAVSDRVTVLRNGRVVGVSGTADTSVVELARMMVGRDVVSSVRRGRGREVGQPQGRAALEVANLFVRDNRGLPAVSGLSLAVREGEILTVAGVEGNGQAELGAALFGLRRAASGSIRLFGRDVTRVPPAGRKRLGMSFIPEDRMTTGLALEATLEENLVAGGHRSRPVARGVRLDFAEISRRAADLIRRYDIRATDQRGRAKTLSGGNLQKVIVAREFDSGARVFVVSQPTRGLDVASCEFIHERILAARDSGCAILLVSTDLDEVSALADRIVVLYRGRVTGEFLPDEATREQIGIAMAGATA